MYILCTKREKIRLKPDKLDKEYKRNIRQALYETYLFKAISDNEIIVAIKEVQLFDGFVEQITAEVQFEIEMTYLVQQINVDEVFSGTIISQNSKGLIVKFGHLHATIVKQQLQPNSFFLASKNEWCWQNDEEDEANVLVYETNSEVKFKVCAVNFNAKIDETKADEQKQIIGTMNGDGLGLSNWWEES